MSVDLKRIVEALLFVAESPLTLAQLAQALGLGEKQALAETLEELRREVQDLGRSFELVEVAGGWAFRTRPELAHWLRESRKDQGARLSRAALETLAIVAYKQPVLKADIERLRGVEVGGVLRMLMEKDLVRVAGRQDLPGRPLIYGTTRRFLEVFDLKDLGDLPTLEEMEALAGPADTLPLGRRDDPTPDDPAPEDEPLRDEAAWHESRQAASPEDEPTEGEAEPSESPQDASPEEEPAWDRPETAAPVPQPPAASEDEAQEPWSEDADCDPPPDKDSPPAGTLDPPFPPAKED